MDDYRWLETLHKEHYSKLYKLARNQLFRYVGSDADADDVVQDAFVLAAKKDIRSHAAPEKWLMKTIVYLCRKRADGMIKEQKKRQRVVQQRIDSSADHSIYSADSQESETGMRETLLALEQTLTAQEWELIQDLYLLRMDSAAVAAQRGMSENALRVRIHRIRRKIRKFLTASNISL